MMTMTWRSRSALLVGSAIATQLLLAGGARAERRRNSLDDQPAVRHRVLLVKNRFELAPAFESSINADFKHTFAGGVKLEYHVSDMWSIGAAGFFGTGVNTGLTSRILDELPGDAPPPGDPTPSPEEFEQHLNTIPLHGAAYITLTPWYGKLAAFGKAFVAFDFYFSAGVAFAQLKSDCQQSICSDDDPDGMLNADPPVQPDNDPNNDPPLNDGSAVGLYLGGGIHVFMTEWMALDLTFRDYMFSDNPSGLDFNADRRVGDGDKRFLNHLFGGVGISIFFPFDAKRTR
jgi:outer membrane beta-barrel protein